MVYQESLRIQTYTQRRSRDRVEIRTDIIVTQLMQKEIIKKIARKTNIYKSKEEEAESYGNGLRPIFTSVIGSDRLSLLR